MAGRLRYLDSRKDEQERGITMKSSAISLFYPCDEKEYLINLMDSPGHVDFSSEVSTAVRLCDGAIVVVDVVEGVQPQTKAVLRQAWDEGIKPILVLNKVDRLIVETKLDTLAAYHHIAQVLEQVNAVMGELFTTSVMGSCDFVGDKTEKTEFGPNDVYDWSAGLDEADDSNLYFAPEQGNVVFGSAIDGWAFSLDTFANIYCNKLGFSESVLRKTLWGDYYINMKAKKILRGASLKAKKPLFVQLVLDNIWAVYEAIVLRKDKEKLEKIVSSLSLKVSPRDLRSTDCRQQLVAVFSSWLPLAASVLAMVCRKLPSPVEMSQERVEKLMCSRTKRFDTLPKGTRDLKQHFLACSSSDEAPTIVFVSKMFPVDSNQLPENRPKPLTEAEMIERRCAAKLRHQEKLAEGQKTVEADGEKLCEKTTKEDTSSQEKEETQQQKKCDTSFIAYARVYSGTLRPGQKLYVLGPKHDPALVEERVRHGLAVCEEGVTVRDGEGASVMMAEVEGLYMLLGRELESVKEVPAGSIVGIGGLENYVLKSATLSSDPLCPPFVELVESSVPILRVAVEPARSSDLPTLAAGLQLLNQADAHVQVVVSEAGEQLLVTAGEVHLQRCLLDLRETYAKCELTVSEPIVPFRETIVKPPDTDMVNETIEVENKAGKNIEEESTEVTVETQNKRCTITMEAFPLPPELTKLLEDNCDILRALDRDRSGHSGSGATLSSHTLESLSSLQQQMAALLATDPDLAGNVWCVGPRRSGPNILINRVPSYSRGTLWSPDIDKTDPRSDLDSSVINGFQLATLAGPLCEEPMMGLAIVISRWEVREAEDNATYGSLSGQVVSCVKEGCRKAFQVKPQRLMAAMYSCNIQVSGEVLGKMFSVLAKRRGRVVQEEMIEGSSMFSIVANLPVIESLDFGNELRKQTSGLAMPQLVFSHWEIIDIDPFWEPQTEEELLHFGEKADSENAALQYMNNVRRRKGLKIDEKIVQFAEKQRTLTKMK